MRFFLDEDLSDRVARIAGNLGLDAHSVHEVNRRNLDDFEHLDYAAEHNMVMVTRNRNDFLALNDEYHATGKPNCGLLIVLPSLPGNQPARIAHRLKEWADEKVDAPESFGPYVVEYLY
jgi:predicted nuclease of predicted toxin-antitoxin system